MFLSWENLVVFLSFVTIVKAVYPTVSTFAGARDFSSGRTNDFGTSARFNGPNDVDITPNLNWAYITDGGNNQLRKVNRRTAEVTLVAGSVAGSPGTTDGQGTSAAFNGPFGVDVSSDGTFAIITDVGSYLIRRMEIPSHVVSTIAGKNGVSGFTDGVGTVATFNNPRGVAISPDRTFVLIADSGHHAIRKMVLSTADVTTFAGQSSQGYTNAIGINAKFNGPYAVEISSDGSYALVADFGNAAVRKIIITSQVVTTLATFDGVPFGVTMSRDRSYALVTLDSGFIQKVIISTGVTSDYVGGSAPNADGDGTSAGFAFPYGISLSPTGRSALVCDAANHNIRKIQILTPPVHLYLR